MNRYSNISARAATLVSEVKQQNYNINDAKDETPIVRPVRLYKNDNIIGVTIGNEPCYGVEKPPPSPPPFYYPTDKDDETIVLQSRGRVGRAGHTDRLNKCLLNIALKKGLIGEIRGNPKDKKLVFNIYTKDGVSTGDKFFVDVIRHWYS